MGISENYASDRSLFLAVGANLGDRASQMREGISLLVERGAIERPRWSSLYETEPVDCAPGTPPFLNAVVHAVALKEPRELLEVCQAIEREMGRSPAPRNSSRMLDLDILLYGARTVREPGLTLPHPRMLGRAFVLFPLAELAPTVEVLPGLTAQKAFLELKQHEAIRKLES